MRSTHDPAALRGGSTLQGAGLAVIALLAHLSFYAATPVILYPDSVRYGDFGWGFVDAFRFDLWDHWTPPAYPFVLWLMQQVTSDPAGVALLQQLAGVCTCLLVWSAACRLFGAGPGFAGGLLVALAPARHYYAQAILSESLAELFTTLAVTSLVFAASVGGARRWLVWRAVAGFSAGLAPLTRANLVVVGPLVVLAPTRRDSQQPASRRRTRLVGSALTAVALVAAVGPWLAYNARRGVIGVTGNAGWQLQAFANSRLGLDGDLAAYDAGRIAPGRSDLGVVVSVLDGYLSRPGAWARSVLASLRTLTVPARPVGDVVDRISTCRGWDAPVVVRGFDPPSTAEPDALRCRVHAAVHAVSSWLVTAGWIGLAGLALVSAFGGRPDVAFVAAIPLACVIALALLLQANTRFAFPVEALALGLGVPALVRGLADLLRRSSRASSWSPGSTPT